MKTNNRTIGRHAGSAFTLDALSVKALHINRL
eukprot:COSAG02_NODE_56124_length_287_cov_0.675532_1_plen_31_part_01